MEKFIFYLAGYLGKTVNELEETLTWRELQRWIWLFEHKPFGEAAQDMRFVDWFTFFSNSKRKKGKAAKKLSYFVKRDRPKKASKNAGESSAEDLGKSLEKLASKFRRN